LRFIGIKRKDTKEEQKKAKACKPHRDLRVPDADERLSVLEIERGLGNLDQASSELSLCKKHR
jgi:hypothetical protein